ncbi:hypothetical protein Hdeb2414_s0007g00226741 [Helianthus debilis subsp. tardiflorus]
MTDMGEMYKYMGISVPPRHHHEFILTRARSIRSNPTRPCHPLPSPSRPCRLKIRPILNPTFAYRIFLSPARPSRFFLYLTFPCWLQTRPIRGTRGAQNIRLINRNRLSTETVTG